jgi:hypothetical protein
MSNTTGRYRATINPAFGRVLTRKDERPLTMREAGSLFGALMMRPGKWVHLAAFASGATRHGGKGTYYAGITCTDDAVVVKRKLQAIILEHEAKTGKPVGFRVVAKDLTEGRGVQVRVNFLDKRRR